MAYSLNLGGGYIQIPKITFTGDFSVTMKATHVANGRFFFGGDTTAGSLEIYRNNSGQVALYIGAVGQFSGTTVLTTNVGTPDTIVTARTGSSVTVNVNGVLQGTTTFSGAMHVTFFGLRQGWSNLPNPMRLYFCDMQDITTPSNSRYYNPSLSGGTGAVLPTVAGTYSGAQVASWPGDDSEWVFYEAPVVGDTFPIVVGASSQAIASSSVSISQTSKLSVETAQQQIATSAVAVSLAQTIIGQEASQSKIDSAIECSLSHQTYINPQSHGQSQGAVVVTANASVLVPVMFGELDTGTILVSQSSPDSQAILVPASVQIADTSIPSILVIQSVAAQTSIQQSALSPIWVTITSGNQIEVPDIELNPRRISFALTTERQRISRTTQLYSLELTTPRYQITRG